MNCDMELMQMGRLSDYRKCGDFYAWDLDKRSRKYVNQHAPGMRRLKIRLKRQERARLEEQHFVKGGMNMSTEADES